MRKLTKSELIATQGGLSFDCGLAVVTTIVGGAAIIAAPPVGVIAGVLTAGGIVGNLFSISRSCANQRYVANGLQLNL